MNKNIGIVSNDAGGANIILSWLKSQKKDFRTYLSGPAVKIFSKYNNKKNKKKSLKELFKDSDFIITGSGWQSNLEFNAIKKAKYENKKVITFLDGWTHYRERFIRKSLLVLPDELWVTDKYAFQLAKKNLKEIKKIKIVSNPYFKEINLKLKKLKKKKFKSINILYATEPISVNKNFNIKCNYTEFDALKFFLKNINKITKKKINKITIRIHPSEKKNKYNFLIKEFKNLLIQVSKNKYLYRDILENNWIVGCNTTPMIVGLINKKKVFSSIPTNSKKSTFPFKGIISISDLIKNFQ